MHKYTPKSVEKTVYLNVFLGALIISQGFNSKTAIQQLSENWKFQAPKLLTMKKKSLEVKPIRNIKT